MGYGEKTSNEHTWDSVGEEDEDKPGLLGAFSGSPSNWKTKDFVFGPSPGVEFQMLSISSADFTPFQDRT